MRSIFLAALFCLLTLSRAGAMDMKHAAADSEAGHEWTVLDDRAFLSAMIAHHEGAVEMAQVVMNSRDRKIRKWAEDIIEDQSEEIAKMRRILSGIGGVDQSAAQAMREDMETMRSNTGAGSKDDNFVLMMIPHHAGAIDMALPALVMTENREIRKLASDIIEEQAEEIAEFRDWVTGW